MDDLAKNTNATGTLRDLLSCLVTYIAFVGLTAAWMTGNRRQRKRVSARGRNRHAWVDSGPGQTMFAEFNITYNANSLLNGQGQSAVPGFKLSVSGFAPKITHNWGVHLLGGDLVSWVAVPVLYEWVRTPAGANSTMGFSNPRRGHRHRL